MTYSKLCKYCNAINRNVSTLLTSFFYKIITNDQFANLYWELGCHFLLKKLTRANSLLWPIVLFLVKIFFVKRFSVNHLIWKSVLIYPFGLLLKKLFPSQNFVILKGKDFTIKVIKNNYKTKETKVKIISKSISKH